MLLHRQKSDKVEWMYTGALGAENRDDFLLGKPVDKTVLLKGTKQDDAATDLLVHVLTAYIAAPL